MRRFPLLVPVALAAAAVALVAAGCGSQSPPPPVRYEITVGPTGWSPDRVQARVGQEVTLVFTRHTEETCGTEVVIPSENDRTVPIPLDQPTEVRIVPREKGEILFTCGMKMFQGIVDVR